MSDMKLVIKNFSKAKVLLIGDIMLDRYIYGDVSRISPEAPIPVLKIEKEDEILGGAGNVLANLSALGCKTAILGTMGKDATADKIASLIKLLPKTKNTLLRDKDRPTTEKSRFIAQNQQILRVDNEMPESIDKAIENKIFSKAEKLISDYDIMVLSDYGKGVLTKSLTQKLIRLANKKNKPVLVDPKSNDFSKYRNASFITPNRKELSEATDGAQTKTDKDIEKAAKKIIQDHKIRSVIATRSEDGLSIISHSKKPSHFRTDTIEVYDVSGAGDTVVAVLAASIATKMNTDQMGEIANIAGSIVVSKIGTAVVSSEELLSRFDHEDENSRLKSWEEARDQIKKWQAKGLKVGFTNGCFDILHHGHVTYLNDARKRCDRLVLGLNHDASVKILKGPTRPINDQNARASVMSGLSSIDMVVHFGAKKKGDDNTPSPLLDFIRPDLLMKGGDYKIGDLPEAKVVIRYGGSVEIMPLYKGYSTTNIIEKAQK
ncbi:MAG: D-glycero-beta-D-manno-heptose-7-phosphate kinase [Pseudomonadota bacterium]